ncbi:hypothetical protein ACOTTU_00575 [Roseobacter sp. EG26]|uniref:hypothetical protein n=1 Tax=Roseobacter sp. EG26 TaxID=3412477 RepID=UPI003CE566D3
MKLIKRASPLGIKLPNISISTEALLDVLQSTFDLDDEVEMQIGDIFNEERLILESFGEISSHLAQVRTPLTVKISGTEIRISDFSSSVAFEEDSEAIARTVAKRLSKYKPAYSLVFKPTFGVAAAALITIVFMGLPSIDRLSEFLNFIFVYLFCASVFMWISFKLDRPRVFHHETPSFWQRNRDNVSLLLIGAAIGAVISNLESVLDFLLRD